MDKFTVDLDQVLNDFEYSELTDQCSKTTKVSNNSLQPVSTLNITKHSINNVFHSLNEYLSTNIPANNIETVDNNIKLEGLYKPNKKESINNKVKTYPDINPENNVKLNEHTDLSIFDKEVASEAEKNNIEVPKSCEPKFDTACSLETEDALQVIKDDFQHDILNIPLDTKSISKYDSSENHIDLKTELQNVVGHTFAIKCDNLPSKSLSESEVFNAIIGFEQGLHLNDQEINKLLLELEEDDEINIDIRETQTSVVNKMGSETVNTENMSNESSNIIVSIEHTVDKDGDKNKEHCTIDFKEVTEEKFNSETSEQVLNSLQINLDNNNEVFSNDEVICRDHYSEAFENIHNEIKVIKTESLESNEFFNYVDTVNQDKTELLSSKQNNYDLQPNEFLNDEDTVNQDQTELLCSREENYENSSFLNIISATLNSDSIIETNDFEKITVVTETLRDDLQVQDMHCSNEEWESCKANLSNPNLSCKSTEIQIENKDSKKWYINQVLESTPTEVQVIDPNSNLETMIINDLRGKENTLEVIPASNNLEICQPAKIEVFEKNEVSSPHLEVEQTKNVDLVQNEESISRPDNLALEIQIIENDRKINLIGAPGSTPYNNIYVNKEFGKEKHKDSSTSTSPTFSDGSSTTSTASTEDIQYKPDFNGSENANDQNQSINDFGETSQMAYCANLKSSVETTDECFEPQEIGELNLAHRVIVEEVAAISTERNWLGKEAPLWIPDSQAISCLHCDMKFTVLKRRHHCRACGLVLCSKCCHLRFRLEYLDAEARVCNRCHNILNKESSSSSSSDLSPDGGNSPNHKPNPNNPSEYCSTISPLQQASSGNQSPPAVMVPVGVLKRTGSTKAKSSKSVMFCDGIRPGSDLTNLDNDFNYNNTFTKKLEKNNAPVGKINRNLPLIDSETNTFIPKNENSLPPTITLNKSEIKYTECSNNINTVNKLKDVQLTFAIHLSLNVHVKIINMECCVNKFAWCFSTEGLINVGQDEIVILLEYLVEESTVPKDVFYHVTTVYNDAVKGNSIKEMGLSLQNTPNFLDSKNHAGFIYIRPTFQCLENVIKPKDPFLIGILIHRWETPWAKLFPLRLILRLGAEYRYYPSPIISTRHRDSVYVEIGHTIINILADFRNFSYSLPQIRGLTIHMEDKITTVHIPVNRYDQVIKSLNNSSDHILAFAGNFSVQADSHLVCIQDTQDNENCYSTHAINIHNKPRKITGASFIVFNGALKASSGLTAKSNIIEDGLMIQVLPEHLKQMRESLRSMKNYTVLCGCVDNVSDETVQIVWSENDTNFNVGVTSAVDNISLTGIASIRVHNGKNYICHNGSRIIRWTEVFIIQNGEDNPKNQDPVDISRVSESIAKATCDALVKYLDLLIANSFQKIGIRVTLHLDNVSYCAGSNGIKLPPIYMKSLDNELIPVLHRITSNNFGENAIVLELIFRILNI